MVDFNSISADGYERIGGKAPQGRSSGERDAVSFQSILLQAQLQRLSAWTDTGLNSLEPVNPFNEYRIILEQASLKQARLGQANLGQASGRQSSENPAAVRQEMINPQLVAKTYELQSARVSLDSRTLNADESQSFSLRDLALLAGGVRGVPGALFQRLIQNESGFNPNAVGSRGGLGLGQLTPDVADDLGLRIGRDRTEGSVWRPESNLDGSARRLKVFHDRFIESGVSEGEAWRFAAGAYNAGIDNIIGAMDLLEGRDRVQWDRVARELGWITGEARARETVEYVNRLQ